MSSLIPASSVPVRYPAFESWPFSTDVLILDASTQLLVPICAVEPGSRDDNGLLGWKIRQVGASLIDIYQLIGLALAIDAIERSPAQSGVCVLR
jgi:hypothetical protein